MKPCPQCGAPLHLAANRWIHTSPVHCLLITLLATAEEIAQNPAAPHLPGARYRKAAGPRAGEGKFGYLAHAAEGAAD
jgi:hypothetical protein